MKKRILSFAMVMVTIISILSCIVVPAAAAGDNAATAQAITLGQTTYGSITESSDKEFYRFTLTTAGRIKIKLNSNVLTSVYCYLYDANSNEIWYSWGDWNDAANTLTVDETLDLTKGTYYFSVDGSTYSPGIFNFSISFTSAGESFPENQNGSNQNTATANTIKGGTLYKGQIALNDEYDFYKYVLPGSGRIRIQLNSSIEDLYVYLFDANGKQLWYSYEYRNATTNVITLDKSFDLTKGTYFISVKDSGSTGNYNFKTSFASAGESFAETLNGNNQTFATAKAITGGVTYKGQIAMNDEKDFYKFTLPTSGRITINLTAAIRYTEYYLYDANGKEVWSSTWNTWNETTHIFTMSQPVDLTKGTYYFAVQRDYSDYTGNYNFKINFTTAGESFAETLNGNNQTFATAKPVAIGKTYKGQLAKNDDNDFYKITLTKRARIEIKATAYINYLNYYIYDKNGKKIWNKWAYWDDNAKKSTVSQNLDLPAGTYYFAASRYSTNYTGNYNFSIIGYTGLAWVDSTLYYFKNGYVNYATGLFKYAQTGEWYFVQNGKVNFAKQGLVKHTDGKWYYVNFGEVDFSKTGLVKHTDGKWYYVRAGQVILNKTGLVQHSDGNWYFVQAGKVNFAKTGLVKHTNGAWYYVRAGMVRFGANTLIKHTDGKWYYVKGGKVTFATTLVKYNGAWYFVQSGKVNFAKTGLVKYSGAWYYVQGGKVNFAKTGLVKHTDGKWYFVQKGKVNFSYNGKVLYNGKYYKVKKGVKI